MQIHVLDSRQQRHVLTRYVTSRLAIRHRVVLGISDYIGIYIRYSTTDWFAHFPPLAIFAMLPPECKMKVNNVSHNALRRYSRAESRREASRRCTRIDNNVGVLNGSSDVLAAPRYRLRRRVIVYRRRCRRRRLRWICSLGGNGVIKPRGALRRHPYVPASMGPQYNTT